VSAPDHGERAHAKLSASGASRWLACTPSANLEAALPDKTSDFAREGTLAHELAEVELAAVIGGEGIKARKYEAARRKIKKSEFYAADMPGYVGRYVDYVLERLAAAREVDRHAFIMLEARLNFGHVVPGGFGSGDTVIVCAEWVEIIDLKYGRGVKVSAQDNPQLRLYGIGALALAEAVQGTPPVVLLTIVQPRLYHQETEALTPEALNTWATETVKPRADLAAAGKGAFVTGDHCQFCRAAATCRALADKMLDLARLDFAPDWTLSPDELREVFEALPKLTAWAKSVADYLQAEALAGRPLPGYKLVLGRGRRSWSDEKGAIAALRAAGVKRPDYMASKLKGLGDVSALMSKDDFEEKLGPYIAKTTGAPVLVPEEDPREPYGLASAGQDFNEPII